MASQNSFGKALASADKSVRDKAVKKLSKYLSNKKNLSELDLLKLWKGLFYCFWMSDKPLVQQQLSEKLASLILKIPDEIALKFIEAFWKEIRLEWNGIDRLRLDKFYYLFRQMHLNSFKYLEKVNWDITHVIKYMDIYTDGPLSLLDQTVPPSLLYHACEVFIPELNKAITKPIPTSVFIEILEPFFDVVGFCSNDILVERVIEELFLNLVNIYENEDANEEKESNIIKSCNFKSIYKRLEKLSGETLVLKKNLEHIDDLIVIFKGLSETQEVLQDSENDEEEEDDDDDDDEEEENENNTFDIIDDNEIGEVESKLKTKGKGKEKITKGKKNMKKEEQIEIKEISKKGKKSMKKEEEAIEINGTTKKGKKNMKKEEEHIEIKETSKKGKKSMKKEESIEIQESTKKDGKKSVKKTNKKRKAEVEPIEIEQEEEEEDEAIMVESPKQKKKNSTKNTKKSPAKKVKKEESPIVISESDEEIKSPPKVPKNIKSNKNKKTKISKEVISESSLKSKSKNKLIIKDKKVKASKSKEDRQIETKIDEDENFISNKNQDKDDLSQIELTKTKKKTKTKTKTKIPITKINNTNDDTKNNIEIKGNKKSKKSKKIKESIELQNKLESEESLLPTKTQHLSQSTVSFSLAINDEASNSISSSPIKLKNTKKNNKLKSSSKDLLETTSKQSKTIKKANKKKKDSKKVNKLSQEEENFLNKILRESNLMSDKSSISNSSSLPPPHPTITDKNSEKIKIESLISPDTSYIQPKGPKGVKRSRAVDFF